MKFLNVYCVEIWNMDVDCIQLHTSHSDNLVSLFFSLFNSVKAWFEFYRSTKPRNRPSFRHILMHLEIASPALLGESYLLHNILALMHTVHILMVLSHSRSRACLQGNCLFPPPSSCYTSSYCFSIFGSWRCKVLVSVSKSCDLLHNYYFHSTNLYQCISMVRSKVKAMVKGVTMLSQINFTDSYCCKDQLIGNCIDLCSPKGKRFTSGIFGFHLQNLVKITSFELLEYRKRHMTIGWYLLRGQTISLYHINDW